MFQKINFNSTSVLTIIAIIVIASVLNIYAFFGRVNQQQLTEEINSKIKNALINDENGYSNDSPGNYCDLDNGNVAKIRIDNFIDTSVTYDPDQPDIQASLSSENIVRQIKEASANSAYEAILLSIDSLGGRAEASEEIALALKKVEKPIVAVIRSSGDSGAYMVATIADRIFASRLSDIGSISVNSSYTDNYIKNLREGITYHQLTSGKFKDTGDSDKPLTEAEKQLLMKDILKAHDIFVKMVAENRNLDINKVQKLADGSTMLGDDALANGLIDEIGGEDEAINWLAQKLNKDVSEFAICDYN